MGQNRPLDQIIRRLSGVAREVLALKAASAGVSAAVLALCVFLQAATLAAQKSRSEALIADANDRLARLDGLMTVPGLDSVVEVRRDRWGVPHIYAKTQHDLFMAQGFVAAQDRLWQMEMARRAGEGRMAEVLGPTAVDRDRFARLLRYRGDMAAEWTSYAPDAREIIHAFVRGVNAYIDQVKDRPPVEFSILGFAPEPWTDDVPLQRMAALAMTGNAQSEVRRAMLVNRMGALTVAALWPLDPPRPIDLVPGMDYGGIDSKSLGAAIEAYGSPAYQRIEGSNNWVVSGRKTASGRPILANDPHRALTVPSLRYLTHLVGPGWNVIGAGEPHLPGVAAGHNERVGFGFTIVGMDQQDVYVESVRPCDPVTRRRHALATEARCYQHGQGWKPIRVEIDTIRVRGEDPRAVQLEFTEHGPIVAEDEARGRAFALRFVGAQPGTAGYLAQISLNRATDWTSFLAAAERWRLPTENLVYADIDGNIGWVAAGLMPLRSWSGLLPVPGDGRFEWKGFLDFAELPKQYNPSSGMIVTANHNIMPAGYARSLTYEWAKPFRARRIESVLDSGAKFTVEDFKALQHDEYSLLARRIVPLLLAASEARDASDRPEIRALARWNLVMDSDSLAPLLFAFWVPAVAKRVMEPRVTAHGSSFAEAGYDIDAVVRLLEHPDAVFGARPKSARDNTLLYALDDAVAQIQQRLGSDRRRWTWGTLHRALFRHPLAEAYDLTEVRRGGDANTVNATGGANFRQRSGASFREILDFANWDNSVATSVPGQSGQPGSPFYDNLLPLWSAGQYFPLVYSRERVERETAHVLTLTPTP